MPKELHKLKVKEISVVDVPANAHAKVALYKRDGEVDAEAVALAKADAVAAWNAAVENVRKSGVSLERAQDIVLATETGRAMFDYLSVDLDAARAQQAGIAKRGATPAADRANRLAAEHHQEMVRQGRRSTHAIAYNHVLDSHQELRSQVLAEERNG